MYIYPGQLCVSVRACVCVCVYTWLSAVDLKGAIGDSQKPPAL